MTDQDTGVVSDDDYYLRNCINL